MEKAGLEKNRSCNEMQGLVWLIAVMCVAFSARSLVTRIFSLTGNSNTSLWQRGVYKKGSLFGLVSLSVRGVL